MNEQTGLSVQCNIILNNGYMCGLPPIGRCATCQRAFCASHQAWSGQNYYIAMCAPCFAKTPVGVALAENKKSEAELRAAKEYFTSGAARTAILTAGVPPVKIYSVNRRSKRSFFGYKEVEDVTPFIYHFGGSTRIEVQHAWILGEFVTGYILERLPDGRTTKWLTALLDLSPAALPAPLPSLAASLASSWLQDPLIYVRPWSRGYECRYCSSPDWIEAAQAVKRLIGESS